jgi:hypothetical protein
MNHNILHICSISTNKLQQPEKRQRLIEWSKRGQTYDPTSRYSDSPVVRVRQSGSPTVRQTKYI